MITLHSFGPFFGLPEPSPFTMKTQVQLKMAGLAYASEYGGLDRAPKHKLPFIDDDGTIVADSTFIRAYIEKTYAVDLDRHLSARQQAQAWAIERMLEDHLYWAVVHARWTDDENFAKGPAQFFNAAPEAIRGAIREQGRQGVTTTLHGQGFGRHADNEVAALARRSFDALSLLLGDQAYLFGEQPSGVDATAFGLVTSALCPFFQSKVREAAEANKNLIAYRDRMMAQYYRDFA
jgi:glutathione S-transferase